MLAARALVGHFKASTQSLEALLQSQLRNNVKIPLNVIQDVSTRWWSTYSMCKRLTDLKLYILLILEANKNIPILSDYQWKIIEALVNVLAPFMNIQKMMEGQKYTTVSLIPYLVFKVRKHLILSMDDLQTLPEVKNLIELMLIDLSKRWGSGLAGTVFNEHKTLGDRRRRKGFPELTMQAAALDPRTKSLIGLGDHGDHDLV